MTRGPADLALATSQRLAAIARNVLGDRLAGAYLHGSVALGGFVSGRSDLDVLFITSQPLPDELREDCGVAFSAFNARPATGLESSIVTQEVAAGGGQLLQFELHVSTTPGDEKVVYGRVDHPDPDLVLYLAVCRDHGIALGESPPAAGLIAPVGRDVVLAQLKAELHWALERAPSHYAVLNACRAWRFLDEGVLCSKVDGGRWAAANGAPRELIEGALAAQQRGTSKSVAIGAAREFVEQVAERLAA